MSSLADLGFTEVDKKIPERRCKIKQILISCFLVIVFLLALVALGLAVHCRSFFREHGEEPDAVDLPSTQQLKQNFNTKDVTLPEGSLYGKCDDVHNICENGATCLMVGPNQDHHICLCSAMFYGRFCQHKIIPQTKSICNDTICLNSGTCIDVGQEEFACLCKYGFHGTRCEELWTVDENETTTENSGLCYKGLCLNSGTCIDVNDNNFACLCQYGYKGSRCEQTIVVDQEKVVTGCANNVCENQGTCLQMENTFICLCRFGFFGGNCQHGIKETTFRVTLSKWENRVTNKKTIKWNRIISNPGGCYDQSNGCYTAPISGNYKFSVQKYGNNKQGSFDVLLDNKQIIYTRHKDPSESFHSAISNFILHLNKGQQVQIQNEISTFVYGTHNNGYISSWFEGHLLYPD